LKITIGTAQFGLKYGISNAKGIPNDYELEKIFDSAKNHGILNLDTHSIYGNAENRIGKLGKRRFNIISKFSEVNSIKELNLGLSNSLRRLKLDSIYGYLAHDANSLIKTPLIWKGLLELKKSGNVEKIGYSLYYPDQLNQLLQLGFLPDLVQLPYSILDRKFDRYLKILKSHKTEIHVRSVFLQGLYFMNPNELPKKLWPLQESLLEIQKVCTDENYSVAKAVLNYVVSNPYIDQLVIGIDSVKQLDENIDLISNWQPNKEFISKLESINVKDKSLLNPSNW